MGLAVLFNLIFLWVSPRMWLICFDELKDIVSHAVAVKLDDSHFCHFLICHIFCDP